MKVENSQQKINQQKPEVIGFWDFINKEGDLVQNYNKHIEELSKYSPFPNDMIEEKHFNLFSEKLEQRIKKYENSECFGFLEKFYEYFKQAYNSKSYEEYDENFFLSRSSLQLFTFCLEKNMKKQNDHINNINKTNNNIDNML